MDSFSEDIFTEPADVAVCAPSSRTATSPFILTCSPTRQSGRAWRWPYCLMPDHVHIIAMPSDADGLWRTFPRMTGAAALHWLA
jgi:hypothetical protein